MPRDLRPHVKHIDKKLRRRLRIYFLISAILLLILLYNVIRGALRWDLGIAALLVGIIVGIVASRMYHISWDKNAKKVISRLDIYGIIILVLYVLLEIFRERIVGFVTHDFEVGTIGFAILAGIMFGRVLGTRGKIIKVLNDQRVFK
jgi:hypothetical protein